ncbi:MAG: LysM peptidoglycan-binding domain-containing protein [Bryobacteraceae bacterium]
MATQDQQFEALKQKYQSVMTVIQQQNVSLQHVNMEGNKLFIQGTAPSEAAKNKVWDAIKAVDPSYSDLTCDITAQAGGGSSGTQAQGAGASVGGGPGSQTYTVKPGDSLSKIAQQFYGSASDYMRIFNANRDKLQDPDKVRVGDQLTIPSQDV